MVKPKVKAKQPPAIQPAWGTEDYIQRFQRMLEASSNKANADVDGVQQILDEEGEEDGEAAENQLIQRVLGEP